MGFIKYSAGNVRTWEPIISAYSRGQFGFSRGAIRLIGLSDGDSIVLFFDEEKGLMAMRKAEDKEEGAVSLSFRQDGSSAIASAKGFFLTTTYCLKKWRSIFLISWRIWVCMY